MSEGGKLIHSFIKRGKRGKRVRGCELRCLKKSETWLLWEKRFQPLTPGANLTEEKTAIEERIIRIAKQLIMAGFMKIGKKKKKQWDIWSLHEGQSQRTTRKSRKFKSDLGNAASGGRGAPSCGVGRSFFPNCGLTSAGTRKTVSMGGTLGVVEAVRVGQPIFYKKWKEKNSLESRWGDDGQEEAFTADKRCSPVRKKNRRQNFAQETHRVID